MYQPIECGSDTATMTDMPLYVRIIQEANHYAQVEHGEGTFASPNYLGQGQGGDAGIPFTEVYQDFTVLCQGGTAWIRPSTPFGFQMINRARVEMGLIQ